MPRIRKKTSRRGTTNQRARIKQKVIESRKKAKKAAKKDVTWKSKKVKDPGIPSNFPYKDQILAEIAEERRQIAEAKERRKEEKKVLRAQQKAAVGANGEHGGDDDSGGEDADGVAMFDVRAKTLPSKIKKSGPATSSTVEEEASGVPPLMNPELPHLAAVLDKADVVIEILDARDPLAHRSKALETQVSLKEGQRFLLVLNKIDDYPREPTAAWAAHLRTEHPTLLFRAASSFLPSVVKYDSTKGKGKEKVPSDDAWGLDAVYALLGRWAREKAGDGPLHVAVVGLTNSGKSAFINSLARKAALDIYAPSSSTNGPSTTPYALEVILELDGKPVVFIDTPGLAWEHSDDDDDADRARRRAQDVLLRNKGRIGHLKDPMPAVSYIVSRAETEDLMVHYCLPAFAQGDADAFLMGVARANALIKKGGDLDLVGAARLVLRDWATGKLPRYAVPPPPPSPISRQDGDSALAAIYAGDAALLERLVPRKELRRSRDVIRLSSGQVDERALAFSAPWFGSTASDTGADGDMEAGRASDSPGPSDDEDASDGDESAESDAQASEGGEDDNDGGNASDGDVAEVEEDIDTDIDIEHVNTDCAHNDGNEADEVPKGTTTRISPASARKRKLPTPPPPPPPSHVSIMNPTRPSKKKVAFADTAKTPRPPPAPPAKAAATATATADKKKQQKRKMTTPDLAASTKINHAKKAKTGGLRSSPSTLPTGARAAATTTAQGGVSRKIGSGKPAANAPTVAQKRKNQAAAAAAAAASEEGAYDFSKFF